MTISKFLSCFGLASVRFDVFANTQTVKRKLRLAREFNAYGNTSRFPSIG